MMCNYYIEMGRCPLIDCKFAHGEQDLAQRELEFQCASPCAERMRSAASQLSSA